MEALTKGQTVWIHSYTVGHGNNIKIKQSVHTDKEKAIEAWRLLGGAFNEAVIVGQGINETPATDAFLAEVRAQGVEMFAKYIALYNSNSEHHAQSFAAQLRKGVQS